MPTTLLTTALTNAARGRNVFPLAPCQKRPAPADILARPGQSRKDTV